MCGGGWDKTYNFDGKTLISMEARYCNPGEDTSTWEAGVKKKWRWGWVEEAGVDGKEPGGCFCVPCARKLLYGSSGKKVLARHVNDPGHISAVRALSYTSTFPGATATATASTSMTDRVCEQKMRIKKSRPGGNAF